MAVLGDAWLALAAASALFLIVVTVRLARKSQRHEIATAEEVLRVDPRPRVIYLRSFHDDGEMVIRGFQSMPAAVASVYGAVMLMSPEQELAHILRRVGPVVAIGKPGEPLPELGAARLYVPHDRWQQTVFSLLDRAALVVVRVGTSAGVMWELDQVIARVPRSKTLFLLLGSGDSMATHR